MTLAIQDSEGPIVQADSSEALVTLSGKGLTRSTYCHIVVGLLWRGRNSSIQESLASLSRRLPRGRLGRAQPPPPSNPPAPFSPSAAADGRRRAKPVRATAAAEGLSSLSRIHGGAGVLICGMRPSRWCGGSRRRRARGGARAPRSMGVGLPAACGLPAAAGSVDGGLGRWRRPRGAGSRRFWRISPLRPLWRNLDLGRRPR